MNTHALLARCAPIAIAIAALPATPAIAQDATTATPSAPVIVIDPAPQTAQPTIVLPTTPAPAPVATTAAPVATETATPAPATTSATTATRSQPTARTTTATTSNRTTAASRPAAATVAPATVSDSAPVTEIRNALPPETLPLPTTTAETAPVETAAVAPEPVRDNSAQALWLGLLAALGIGVAGYAVMRSRRRRSEFAEAPVIERPIVPAAAATPAFAECEPAVCAFDEPVRNEPEADRSYTPAYSAATAGYAASTPSYRAPVAAAAGTTGAVALPEEMPETFEERDALLRRMVDAEPDRANPFRSPRARARRARLIMQSLGRNFNSRKPRFDLSQYTSNWPALRGWQPATA